MSIRSAVERAVDQLVNDPEAGVGPDATAVATLEDGLRMRVQGPRGEVVTDMGESVGGAGSGPTPGWLMRAALASCDATVIAIEAAREGIELTALTVTVDSESDARGVLGVGDGVPPGPLGGRRRVHPRDRRQDRALALRNVIARSSSQVWSSRESFHRPDSVSPSSENRPSNRCEKPGSSRAIRSTPSSTLTS